MDANANASANASTSHSGTSTNSCAAAHSSANASPAAANTGPVLHWPGKWMHCALLFGRVVRRERIQLRCLRWQLVRRLFTGASSTNTCGEPKSYTSSSVASGTSGTGPVLYWSRRRVQRPLLYGRVVRRERIQLLGLRGRLVQLSISACVRLHDEASERPRRLSGVDGRPCPVMAASEEGAEQLGNE